MLLSTKVKLFPLFNGLEPLAYKENRVQVCLARIY